MESRIKDTVSSWEAGFEDVCMIGIKGIEGGVKTTLARAIFEKISFQFQGNCFVENFREVSKTSLPGLRSLQEQVLSSLLNDKTITIGSVHDGKSLMRKMLRGKKVLVVLDDVDHLDQLDALAGELNWFVPGSRIIITTRDEQVLIAHRVNTIHDVNLLSDEEAICLFSRYSFCRDVPVQMYKELSLEVVHYAAGLPLTIRILGSFLCGKNELEWEDALKRLKTIPLKETLEKLDLRYTNLEDNYKEIFLDVACLLKGWRKDDAIRALESCGFRARNGLRVLEQKSLITISRHNVLSMHDRIEEMGQNIVRRSHPDEPIKHSRLWIQREIDDVLAHDLVPEATRAITINTFSWHGKEKLCFGNMKKLRFLHVVCENNTLFKRGQEFPNALRYLSWQFYTHCCLSETFQANNLLALELSYSRTKQLWGEGKAKVLNNLCFLDLSYSDLITLDCGLFPNLETLNLEYCCRLVELNVPIGSLRKLVYLDLNRCWGLKSLSFIKQLEILQVLNLSYLYLTELPDIFPGNSNNYSLLEFKFSGSKIEELPSSIGNLQKLVSLDLSWCERLKSLPQSIFGLRSLKHLFLVNCAIEELPEDLGNLETLEWLNLEGTCVKHLPNSICMLKHLKTLLLARCKVLKKLPEDLGLLESLEELCLSFCTIRDVPRSICKLKHLSGLDLSNCDHIEKLPEKLGDLKCLKVLNVEGTSISQLPQSICLLKGLNIIGFKS